MSPGAGSRRQAGRSDPAAALATMRAQTINAQRSGQIALASQLCDLLLASLPDDVELLHLRALIDRDGGDIPRGIGRLRRAIQLRPDVAAFHLDLGTMLLAVGRLEDAVESAQEAARLAPAHIACWYSLGNIHYARGQRRAAQDAYSRAVACDPKHPQANNNLGLLLFESGDRDGARRCFRQALHSNPRYAVAANNLGTVFDAEGDAASAQSWFAIASSLDAAYLEPILNLAASLDKQGEWRKASGELTRALELAPNNIRGLWNLGLAQLRMGDLAAGWPFYEHGIGIAEYRGPARPFAARPFKPNAKRMLLWGEQGLGDQVMYGSMLQDVVAAGIDAVVEVDPRLVAIFARSFPELSFVPGTPVPAAATTQSFDVAMPLASLGGWLRPDFASFPRHAGYLRADRTRVAELRKRYADDPATRLVGISWMSGARRHADAKSMDLRAWEPVLRQPGITFVSLQYGDDAATIARIRDEFGVDVIDDPELDQLRDIDGLGAQIAAMDHVVTISNATAHLAGALGVPTTVLLPRDRGLHWYWFIDRPDSPWYPSLTLLRQTNSGSWDDVVAAAAQRLAENRRGF